MLVKPKFRPGINKTDTALQNEGGYSDGNRVRFYQGQPQPIGGWGAYNATQYDGRTRGSHAWTNLQSQPCLAFATEQKLYGGVNGGTINDITPFQHFTTLNNALSTTIGSNVVTVAMTGHGLVAGQTVTFSNQQAAVDGITLSGNYTVTSVTSPNAFTVTAGVSGTSGAINGGKGIDITATLPTGAVDSTAGGADARVSSLDNFGENLIYNPSGYTIFAWQPETAYPDLAVNGTFATPASWATTGGFNVTVGAAVKTVGTAGNLSQNIAGLDLGGRVCIVRFTVTVSATGELRFKVNAGAIPAVISVGTASTLIETSGTYERIFIMPADPVDIVFEAATNLGATIDNVSYGLYSKAYPITTAPTRVDQCWVDSNGVIVAAGCTTTEGVYDGTCVRNSDIANAALWIPDTDNVASEVFLRGGGRMMAGCATGEQSVVWGDDAMFALAWLGQPGAAFDPFLLSPKCGLLSRHSFVKAGPFIIFATNTKEFWMFEGVADNTRGKPIKIPSPLRDDFFDNFDMEQALKCHGGLNPAWTEAWFWSPDTRDVSGGAAGECSRYVAFNWVENAWHCGLMARTSWIASGAELPEPIAFEPAASNKTLIYKHETGTTAAGALLGAWIKTSALDLEDGDKLSTVVAIAPDFKAQSGDIEVTFYGRDFPNAPELTYGPYVLEPGSDRVPTRVMGREISLRFDWVTTGGFGRSGAHRFDMGGTGARRSR